jgi:hypothetical protein
MYDNGASDIEIAMRINTTLNAVVGWREANKLRKKGQSTIVEDKDKQYRKL